MQKQYGDWDFNPPKADGNGSIGAAGYSHILAIPHQPADELVNSDSFAF
jgi:hypothetical protein